MDKIKQDVTNNAPIQQQLNVQNLSGNIEFSKVSRLAQRFKRLKEEIEKDIRYNDFIDDFNSYNTELDGKSMPDKLTDGGFSRPEILKATYKKHLYSKKLERNRLYETAQRIDLELFAIINLNFETYVEPLIREGVEKRYVLECVNEKIIMPIFTLINQDGQDDTFLNYTVDHIAGMIFFLTGKCHLNWAVYDSLQSGV